MGVRRVGRTRQLLICASLLLPVWEAPSPQPAEISAFVTGEQDWVSLFEGDSSRGWIGTGDSQWRVEKSLLTGQSGELLNRWCWVDFELEILYSGRGSLLFRVGSDQTGHIGFGQLGYRLDLRTGAIRTEDRELSPGVKTKPAADLWYKLSLVVSSGTFRISVDDKPLTELSDDSSPLKGRIGFAAGENGPLRIRHVRVRPLNLERPQNIPAENDYCYVCHANFEYDEPLVSVHEEVEVGCSDCHGPSLAHRSDEDNVTPPDIFYRRSQVESACLHCHTIHESRPAPDGAPDRGDPICTDCHGAHKGIG